MKIMTCPLNGPCNISEFVCAGEVRPSPDPNGATDEAWADHVFMHDNAATVVREWWCHVATAYWFIAERDTVKDEIIRTYEASEIFKDRIEFSRPEAPKDETPGAGGGV